MKKILAISGSMSRESINTLLVEFTARQITDAEVEIVKLSEFESPLYSKEREMESGIPSSILALRAKFDAADAFILSTPEYNGSIPGGLKNTLDWISRTEGKIFQEKPVLLMAASPGGRGGKSVLDHLLAVVPYWGAKLSGTFSLPSFQQNLIDGVMSQELRAELNRELDKFIASID